MEGRPSYYHFWGKAEKDSDRYHPLLCHCLDVAAVAAFVWDHCLNSKLRERLKSSFGVTDVRTQVVFLSGAHDIGKACPSFQKRMPKLCEHLELPFSGNDQQRPHGLVSAHVLNNFPNFCFSSTLPGQIIGGHHGVFPRSTELQIGRDILGNDEWKIARNELLKEIINIIGPSLNQSSLSKAEITDSFLVPVFAGFVSVVDWIGSNKDFFPCVAECGKTIEISAAEYWKYAQKQAQEALYNLGWLPSVTFAEEMRFKEVFPDFTANNLQTTVTHLASKQTSPYLMIMEAPMGCGKTEAALYAADLAMCRGFARGMYVAMPTQATSNAMFKRVLDNYLKKRGHGGKLNVQLVHGDALLAQMAEAKEGEIPEFAPKDVGEEDSDVEAQSWFTAKKRPLLAPFGIGTIDQGLLSVLQTRHWFVRLFGIAGKIIIFDEVHAYDTYMSTILERLLRWLAELDCTVIILSATLPEAKRKALVNAYSGFNDSEYKRYPRLTLAKPRHYPSSQAVETPISGEIPMGESYPINLHVASTDIDALATMLMQKLESGGCAAVICDTVDRSIKVYKHLRDKLKNTDCSLFHARTLRMWRREREEEVLRRFGKRDPQDRDADGYFINPDRPFRAVLVATQVIEQSLDLDFDIMVSEIAPIDLLLQRLGRLHRHPRLRPQGLKFPQFIMLCDAATSGPPPKSFGKDIECVYDRHILLRTWLVLRERKEIKLPNEIEPLVEAVYSGSDTFPDQYWKDAVEDANSTSLGKCIASKNAARRLLVSEPENPSDLIEEFNEQLFDDEDPNVHEAVRAATREGGQSITTVMLPLDMVLTNGPDIREIQKLLDNSVKISHRGVFHVLLENGENPKEWEKNVHLRYARLLRLDGQNQGRVGKYALAIDKNLGVTIVSGEDC